MHFCQMKLRVLPASIFAFGLACSSTPMQTRGAIAVGDPLPALQINDQHDRAWNSGLVLKLLLFTATRKGGEVVHEVFQTNGAELLQQKNAAIVADIHRMPLIITRLVALPRMRDYSYPVYLIRDDSGGAAFPQRSDQVTVLRFVNGRVAAIDFAADAESLRALLE